MNKKEYADQLAPTTLEDDSSKSHETKRSLRSSNVPRRSCDSLESTRVYLSLISGDFKKGVARKRVIETGG